MKSEKHLKWENARPRQVERGTSTRQRRRNINGNIKCIEIIYSTFTIRPADGTVQSLRAAAENHIPRRINHHFIILKIAFTDHGQLRTGLESVLITF